MSSQRTHGEGQMKTASIVLFCATCSLCFASWIDEAAAQRGPQARFFIPRFQQIPQYYQQNVRPYTNPGSFGRPVTPPKQYIDQFNYYCALGSCGGPIARGSSPRG